MEKQLHFIKETLDFCKNTAQVVQSSFGPNGLDCMVSKISGGLLVTNNGYDIIKSLSCNSPYGQLVFKGLEAFFNHNGDFSKKFIILLCELLAETLRVTTEYEQEVLAQQELLCIAQGMRIVSSHVIPMLSTELNHLSVTVRENSIEQNITSVMRTNINGKFGPKTCDKMIDLLKILLFEKKNDTRELIPRVDKLVDHFSEIFLEVPGFSFSSSTILPGILIPRDFVTMLKKLPKEPTDTVFNFILLGASLGYDLPQSETVLEINNMHETERWLGWRARHVQNVIQKFSSFGINLIISSQALPETVVHFCNQYEIAAIQLVPKEDMKRLCNIFKINSLFEISIEGCINPYIGIASCCKPVQIGQHTYAYLKPNEMDEQILSKQVVLYAPCDSMCRRYSVALKNILKTVKNALPKNNERLASVISGGGVFEVGLSLCLERYRRATSIDCNVQKACCILEKALLAIPRYLVQNAGKQSSICNYTAQIKDAIIGHGKVISGINKNGELCDLVKDGVIEPLLSNILLVSSVIQLFVQLARTDQVVYVKRLPNVTDKSSDSQCEDSDSE